MDFDRGINYTIYRPIIDKGGDKQQKGLIFANI